MTSVHPISPAIMRTITDRELISRWRKMPRRVQGIAEGDVIAFRDVGGLHHRYERRVA
jgi:hypothetical protein